MLSKRQRGGFLFCALSNCKEDPDADADAVRPVEPRSWEVVPPEEDYRRQEVVGKLPVERIRHDLNKALEKTQVVVVSGGTGSGKSTQLPQFLVDDWRQGSGGGALGRPPAVIVTQPRRIAAVSIAQRVAWERNEDIGWGVGYSIRGKRLQAEAHDGTMEFVTTGTLLRRVINDPFLQRYSVVVLDEVHERDLMTDFLLILIREVLPRRPDLRVVLMSATLDVGTFARYFKGCAVLEVPSGPRFPVEEVYLDSGFFASFPATSRLLQLEQQGRFDSDLANSAQEDKKVKLVEQINESRQSNAGFEETWREYCDEDLNGKYDPEKHSFSQLLEFMASQGIKAFAGKRRLQNYEDAFNRDDNADPGQAVALELNLLTGSMPYWGSDTNDRSILDVAQTTIMKLVPEMLRAAETAVPGDEVEGVAVKGSLLCFLPGWGEIRYLADSLSKESNMWIVPLHSTLPQEEQQLVFKEAPDGKIKVILATSIAESSVTINDVTVVVDAGLVREMTFDPHRKMSAMDLVWTSQSSAIQRKGRSGRVRNGRVFRLYSRDQFACLPWRSAPEIQRVDLARTCLQAIVLRREPRAFLEAALDPPRIAAVEEAMSELVKLEALQEGNPPLMTPVGEILGRMPMDPRLARAAMMGSIFGLPKLTAMMLVVAGDRTPFNMPLERRKESLAKQRTFCNWSDPFSALRALQQWERASQEYGLSEARRWSNFNYLNQRKVMSLSRASFQLLRDMQFSGLLGETFLEEDQPDCAGDQFDGVGSIFEEDQAVSLEGAGEEAWFASLRDDFDAEFEDEPLLAGLLCSAFPGNLAHFTSRNGKSSWYRTQNLGKALLSKQSVNAAAGAGEDDQADLDEAYQEYADSEPGSRPWVLFGELTVNNGMGSLRNSTVMEPWQVALFGGRDVQLDEHAIMTEDPTSTLQIDRWLDLKGPKKSIQLALGLRQELREAVMWQALAVTQDPVAAAVMQRVRTFFKILRDLITGRDLDELDLDFMRTWQPPEIHERTPDKEELQGKNVVELRAILKELGLKVSGRKHELVQRSVE
ncbi:unnamed protein product, partial [Polarella glacialis]